MKKRLQRDYWLYLVSVCIWLCLISPAKAAETMPADTCQHPAPPTLSSSAASVCRYDSVVLSAADCAGTVVWSTGDFGTAIRVHPQQNTTYTAICRLQPGCISCFAEPVLVKVNTPAPPVITASATRVCPGDVVSLTASQCSGTVRWSDQQTGSTWTGRLSQNTTFRAVCEANNCVSAASKTISVEVSSPTVPVIRVSNTDICTGQPVMLVAANCLGTVRWSDGGEGMSRTVRPMASVQYRATCMVGTCQSDSSASVAVAVRPAMQQLSLATTLTNTCPYQTADLTKAISNGNTVNTGLFYVFRSQPALDTPPVQTPVAVLAGTYYIAGYTTDGCYTAPVAVSVTIAPCANAIAPCQSNPPSVQLSLTSIDWQAGVAQVQARLGGVADRVNWQSSGNGLFTDNGPVTRYLLSESDLKRRSITFTVSTPDPDGSGACAGATDQLTAINPVDDRRGTVGLGQQVKNTLTAVQPDSTAAQAEDEVTTLFIPEGFSPNGDGVNDRFVLRNVPTDVTVRLDVYNRWGNRVYHQDNYQNDWDGRANQGGGVATGQTLPDGTYFYQIQLSDGREFTRFLTIAR